MQRTWEQRQPLQMLEAGTTIETGAPARGQGAREVVVCQGQICQHGEGADRTPA